MSLKPLSIIIDTDPGVDDILALLLALQSRQELNIKAITLTHGNTSIDYCLSNLNKLFYALEKEGYRNENGEKITVFMGEERPLRGKPVTAKYFHGRDGLANCDQRHPELTPPPSFQSSLFTLSPQSALQGIQSLIDHDTPRDEQLAYVALGPLTNLAKLARERFDLVERRFECICSMGGSFTWGNTTPTAEFNYYADPYAAQELFSLSLPNFYMFPLDITSYITLPFNLYTSHVDPHFIDTRNPSHPNQLLHPSSREGEKKQERKGDGLIHFTSSFLEGTKEVMESFGGNEFELHDPSVIFALIGRVRYLRDEEEEEEEDEEKVEGTFAEGWEWKRIDFEIECEGTLTRGMLVRDLRPSSQLSTSITFKTGEKNRSIAIEQSESIEQQSVDVAEVESKKKEENQNGKDGKKNRKISGCRVVLKSPGSEGIRKEMLEKIWGVEYNP